MSLVILVAVVLGVASRIEETTGVSAGVSTDATWLGVAFAAGAMRRRSGPGRAALAGSVALTVANAAYYAWIGVTEPGVPLSGAAGPLLPWFALGVTGGVVFGLAGRVWASSSAGGMRLAASLPLAGVLIADGIAHRADPDGVAIAAAGVAFPLLSGRLGRESWVAGLFVAATVGLAFAGRLDPFLP